MTKKPQSTKNQPEPGCYKVLTSINQSKSRKALKDIHACFLCCREKYAQYLSAQVLDSQGHSLRDVKSSFYYHLTQLAWVPAYKPMQDGKHVVEYLIPNRVYLFSEAVHLLLGSHVCYVKLDPSEFSRAVGKQVSTCPSAFWVRKWTWYESTWEYLLENYLSILKINENCSNCVQGWDTLSWWMRWSATWNAGVQRSLMAVRMKEPISSPPWSTSTPCTATCKQSAP